MVERTLAAAAALILLGSSVSCGNPGPAPSPIDCTTSRINGSWLMASTTEVITFNSQCVYSSTVCAVRGTTSLASGASGTVTLSGLSTTLSSCNVPSSKTCQYSLSADLKTLTFNCTDPTGAASGGTYSKQ